MQKELEPFRLLTIKQAAELLRVSPRTIQAMIQRKELTAFRVGHQWRIRESQLTKWIQDLGEL
jgi:excisionase family DNA binding protein